MVPIVAAGTVRRSEARWRPWRGCAVHRSRSAEAMDALLLARMQFAANITFHILFPTISIGLGWVLLFLRARWLQTHDQGWLDAYRFSTKVFALSLALG